jgi:DNA-binding NarL/FixJ family response regulator
MIADQSTIRVLLADDQTMVRQGIRALLSFAEDVIVVAEAANGAEALELAHHARPHVVLMDVHMPLVDGITATQRIREDLPDVAVIILTTFDHDAYVIDAVRAGACGFLLKDGDGDDLLRAVRLAAEGDAVIAPRLLGRLLTTIALTPGSRRAGEESVASLTDRERDVLKLIAAGRNNVEIAHTLHVSEATVKTHIGHVFAKLAVRDRAQAVVAAYESGLVLPGASQDL